MTTLLEHLAAWAAERSDRGVVVETVAAIASAAVQLGTVIAQGPLASDPGHVDGRGADSHGQKALEHYASELFVDHLRGSAVATVALEEAAEVIVLRPDGLIAVAMDPLDGVNNVEINAPLGTVFSLLPAIASARTGRKLSRPRRPSTAPLGSSCMVRTRHLR